MFTHLCAPQLLEQVKASVAPAKWKARSVAARASLGMPATAKPWTKDASLRGVPPGERVRDVLDIAFQQATLHHPGMDRKELLKNLWCDISQNCDRGLRYTFAVPCFTTNSVAYSFGQDACLSGAAQFRALGWGSDPPPMPLEYFSNGDARDLSGDAYSVPMASAATMVCFLNPYSPWWGSPGQYD